MASVSWAGSTVPLLVAMALLVAVPVSSQRPQRKNIAFPDFPCGQPYGPNGEKPSETPRVKRQIIFPDDKEYKRYLGILLNKGSLIDPRDRPEPTQEPTLEDAFCGAVPISDRFLVTAAHCINNDKPISSVRLGDIDLASEDEENSRPQDYDIMQIIVHPGYQANSTARYNDIALLMTYETIQFNDAVFPYCIPDEEPPAGTIVTVSGFGLYNATTQSSHVLEANLTIVDTKTCEEEYIQADYGPVLRLRYPVLLQNTDIICATDKVSDACQGDSGGPLIWNKDGKQYLAGVVGAGVSCRGNFKSILPGLYLSTPRHLAFISDYVFGLVPTAVP